MRSLLFALGFVFCFQALAERSGTDERIHICQTDAEATRLGKNKVFRAHITAGKEIKLTRIKDKKWFRAKPETTFAYLFDKKIGGNLWNAEGYLGDVDENGELVVSIQEKPGSYTNERMQCKLVRTISELDPLTKTEKAMYKIAEDALLANGTFDVSKFNLEKFDVELEKDKLNKTRWKRCTWDPVDKTAKIISLIKTEAGDAKAARRVQALQEKVGILKAIAIISDGSVECSSRFFWIYTKDGHKLELNYSQGD